MLRRPPNDVVPVSVEFADGAGDQIALKGYRIDGAAAPGGQLVLTYVWYAANQPRNIYSVFNHLLTAEGQPVAQADGWPQGGAVLTSQWRPGEYIRDSHTLDIPTDAPPGPYILAVGLYDAASANRMQALVEGQLLPNDQWLLTIGADQEE